MDNVTLIRVIAAVLFFVVLFALVQRRKHRAGGARAYVSGGTRVTPAARQRN